MDSSLCFLPYIGFGTPEDICLTLDCLKWSERIFLISLERSSPKISSYVLPFRFEMKPDDGYSSFAPYAKAEQELIDVGFDVLVFVPSMDEEDGLVTCGNAVLGGSELRLENNDMKIIGIKKE